MLLLYAHIFCIYVHILYVCTKCKIQIFNIDILLKYSLLCRQPSQQIALSLSLSLLFSPSQIHKFRECNFSVIFDLLMVGFSQKHGKKVARSRIYIRESYSRIRTVSQPSSHRIVYYVINVCKKPLQKCKPKGSARNFGNEMLEGVF